MKKTNSILLIALLVFSSMPILIASAQTPVTCDQCGMTLDAMGLARYQIVDAGGHSYHACCPICAFKLIKTYGELNITSFCDYYGPSHPITINAKMNGSSLTVNPQTALVILGGSCSKNRLVYDSTAADALLAAPNNGTSQWLSPMQNMTVASTANRMTAAQSVLQQGGGAISTCESCGMTVDVTGQTRFKIFDASGTLHIACCPICAFKLLKTYGNLNITAFCDYNGPNYPINIVAKNNGADTTVTPSDALIILGGGCTKNRIVFNSSSADALLAPPNNGTSKWLSTYQNDTVAPDATRIGIAQAAAQYGAVATPTPTPSPSPSPTPTTTPAPTSTPTTAPSETAQPSATPESTITSTPTPSASPTLSPAPTQTASPSATTSVIKECETCGMDVTADSQARYQVTDGNGNIHYVECMMCALSLINDYEIVNIRTYCDWYGPNYPIAVVSSNYGASVTVTPSTALFLRGGSCVTARAAYNQTAADNLLTNGFSQYTSPEQQYALPSSTEVKTIANAIQTWYALLVNSNSDNSSQLTLIVAAIVGIAVIIGTAIGYKKIKH
jgi:hypothetical protein